MTTVIYLPPPPKLKCDANGNINFKQMDEYFMYIGQIPGQLKNQASAIAEDCAADLFKAIAKMEKLINEITGILMTDVFKKIKSWEQEMEYKVREFFREIEIFFQKKIIEILLKILKILGLDNIINLPLPFIGPCDMVIDGKPQKYQPKVLDLFTKDGKARVKSCMADELERIKKFFGIDGKFDGKLGIKSPEHEAEEIWQKIVNWLNKTLEDFIGQCVEAMMKLLTKIPIIGPIIKKLLAAAIDPTITIEEAFKQMWKEWKAKIEKAIDDVLSGKTLENRAKILMDQLIDKILNIPIPIFGTLGALLGIIIEEEYKKKKIISKESILHKIEDKFEETIQKIRKFFHGGLIKAIYNVILKAPGWILKHFPIVGKIFKVVEKIVKFLSGQNPLTVCDVMNIILPPIFNLASLLYAFIPGCIKIEYREYGKIPDSAETKK